VTERWSRSRQSASVAQPAGPWGPGRGPIPSHRRHAGGGDGPPPAFQRRQRPGPGAARHHKLPLEEGRHLLLSLAHHALGEGRHLLARRWGKAQGGHRGEQRPKGA